ncbi:uncharacterized protein KY384_004484 [Bacidia gigantensis]|uniref:uncharacterized protein n=1 Tax=Bacidia gigantensis TaxID=2732470 RepID=UPI001D05B659|nr:uncharacterized protein KY384_004484 [Bacidia gigantensis]KAG8531127.1 hypothetical protein KY384_004484 [Bacidia gigantensis]
MTVSSSSLAYRFKAGSSSMASEPFHHRRSSQNTHKPFKSRYATKSLIKEIAKGKIDGTKVKGARKTPHQQAMSKLDRRNHAKQIRHVKQQQKDKSISVFAGPHFAPRIVAVVPLDSQVDTTEAIARLSESADATAQWPISEGQIRVRVERFKQNLLFIPVKKHLLESMDVCRAADFVVLLLSAEQEPNEESEMILKVIEGQGISNSMSMIQGLEHIEQPKRKAQIQKGVTSWISMYFPEQEKVLSLDSDSECSNAIRSLCTTTPKGIRWREDRSWMLAESVRWLDAQANQSPDFAELVVTGVVRGKGLKADRLVQVGDLGHFQIEKIVDATLPVAKKRKAEQMAVDETQSPQEILQVPGPEQDDTNELAPYEAPMDDADALSVSEVTSTRRGVLLDDHHYFSEDEDQHTAPPKRLPKGTSNYQSAWFLGDISDSGSDFESVDGGSEIDIASSGQALPEDGTEGLDQAPQLEHTEITSEYPQSEMFIDPSPEQEATQIEEYRRSRKDEAEEDREFPDEIELHPNVAARERLSKYRGLKSLKTSPWDNSEDRAYEPNDWNRLLPVSDFKRARKQAVNDALIGGVQPGKRVHVHLSSIPLSLRGSLDPSKPLSLYSFLRHEHKRSVVNVSISLPSTHPAPLKSKDELVVQIGPRRFIINPLFSQLGNTPNDVHKFIRYHHPGQTAVATFLAPVSWGAVPALFFQTTNSAASSTPDTSNGLTLIAKGTVLPPSTTRVIAKRVILTGHPYKIHKKLVTIRYMFFNKEDVSWFKALQLWTKRGRSGFIKESLGTHGYFKATFDGKINPMDAVGVSLYKRVWPRLARPWREESSDNGEGKVGEEREEKMIEG